MTTSPWQLSGTEWQRLVRELQFKHHKWDVYACGRCLVLPESIVLTPEEHQRVVRVCERFASILSRIEAHVLSNDDALLRLGIPEEVIPLLKREPSSILQLARYDLFPGPDGRWQVSEFNEDVPGGFNEAVGIPEILGRHHSEGSFVGDLKKAMLQAFDGFERIALLYATGYSEDMQHMLVVRDWLAAEGIGTVLGSPSHLKCGWMDRRIRVMDEPVDACIRFYPGEWFRWLPNRRDWERAIALMPMMNPLRRLIRQSKRLFIDWGRHPDLTSDDHAFLREHAPGSVPFESERIDQWRGEERSRWVLKQAFGRMGDSVVLGSLVSAADWDLALADAAKRPQDFLMQEKFEVQPMNFAVGALYPAMGAFLVNGRFAGYYSRAAASPFITHEAFHVATLVQNS